MFPFRFDYIKEKIKDKHEYYKKHDFDARVKIDNSFKQSLHRDGWEYQKFKVEDNIDYNEISYFYDFVKDTLFNTQEFEQNATSYYFEKKDIKNQSYIIKIVKRDAPYELSLSGITLRLFDTGVGILSFELENSSYASLEDVLNINEYGRRIYPQFLSENFSTEYTKQSFLAEYIEVCGIREDFIREYKDIHLAKYIVEILGENSFSSEKNQIGKNFIQPIIDDRMFVISWYGNNDFSDSLKNRIWEESNEWYRYVFVDGKDKTVQDDMMQKELITQATYSRWNNSGTLYGITRYSFVAMTDRGYFGKNIIQTHIKTIYFQMITLLLAQRASLLRFSDEITAISDIQDKFAPEKITILYKNYLRFANKLYFKEITAQDQGIELYDKASEIFNIKRDVDDLIKEIATLNSYAFVLQEKEEKEQMNNLTRLGTLFLPGTFIAGIFGMNTLGFLSNYIGPFLSFSLVIGITWYLSKVHHIPIKDFFFPKGAKK